LYTLVFVPHAVFYAPWGLFDPLSGLSCPLGLSTTLGSCSHWVICVCHRDLLHSMGSFVPRRVFYALWESFSHGVCFDSIEFFSLWGLL
jgi:hypothetical protein